MSDKIKFSAFIIQGTASIIIALSNIQAGLIFSWPSCTVNNYISNNTVLSSPMSTIEISLMGSLNNFGSLLVTPLCGIALRKFGRKYSSILYAVPFVIAWTTIYLTTYIPLVILATSIGGMGSAGLSIASVYISEISQDSVRGAFTSLNVTFFLLGLLLSYVMSECLTYYQILYVYISLSILNVVLLAIQRESHVFLMQNGREEEAAKSIAFYRRVNVKSTEVDAEINKIKLQLNLNKEFDDDKDEKKELLNNRPNAVTLKSQSEWKLLLKSESSKRALSACLITMITTLMMGITVLQVYAEPLFKEAVPSMDSSKCAIYLGLDLIFASFVSALIVDNIGRKNLLTASSVASGICAILLGIQLMLHWAPHLYTALIIYIYTFVFSLGGGTVPFILPAEVFMPEVRGLCNSLSIGSMWVTCFVSLFIFNPLVKAVGLGVVFCGFSVICFIGALYSHICLPETKGLSADAIQVLFTKRKTNRRIILK